MTFPLLASTSELSVRLLGPCPLLPRYSLINELPASSFQTAQETISKKKDGSRPDYPPPHKPVFLDLQGHETNLMACDILFF